MHCQFRHGRGHGNRPEGRPVLYSTDGARTIPASTGLPPESGRTFTRARAGAASSAPLSFGESFKYLDFTFESLQGTPTASSRRISRAPDDRWSQSAGAEEAMLVERPPAALKRPSIREYDYPTRRLGARAPGSGMKSAKPAMARPCRPWHSICSRWPWKHDILDGKGKRIAIWT
ncbi:hypothetical protein BP5796_00725 [Coleophoma crateriformis]|uniref:Uncharacterized protein n=1 Tax=Coleophoma crateriformis TaxID=565419 RepID=A0A3D8T8P4_9HELO|nr:hypothetical protein BP5796_00725 [Coleophoma crateriformis]